MAEQWQAYPQERGPGRFQVCRYFDSTKRETKARDLEKADAELIAKVLNNPERYEAVDEIVEALARWRSARKMHLEDYSQREIAEQYAMGAEKCDALLERVKA
ncbi:MAG: hypothetical protein AAF607_03820 [Pseudomonadota bacterium]